MKEKKILLIGRFNTVTQSINEYLGEHFHVQLCADSADMVESLLKISVPDLVVISLIGIESRQSAIFSELRNHYSSVPCICIGTTSEQDNFGQYLRTKQFQTLTRPVSNSDLLTAINEQLSKRKCILLVDDNPIQLRSLRGILQNDYDVMMAVSGAEALVAIGKKVPDLIFLDYEMPVCDGKMTLEMIRNLDGAKEVPVIFLTAVRDEEHIRAVLELKPAGYLLKPASQNKIEEIVKKTIM